MRNPRVWGGLALGLALFSASAIFLNSVSPPSYKEVREGYRKSDILIYDRFGEPIHETRINDRERRLEWIELSAASPSLLLACILAEDRDFRSHAGIDWGALAAAGVGAVFRGETRGASTISMQTASLIEDSLQPKKIRRSVWQKFRQIAAARLLEDRWNKNQILEAYLNLVSFRGELQGIAAASRGLFAKEPHGLNDAESVLLAALIRSPNASAERVARRARLLSEAMGAAIPEEALLSVATQAFSRQSQVASRVQLAPHVARRLLGLNPQKGPSPQELQATLWGDLQRFALQTLRQQLLRVSSRNVQDGAILVADNLTGEVLAYVGNGADFSSARYVDGVSAFRQAGSTLKPFLYALAFDRRILTPASLLEDNPLNLAAMGGVYRPSNYDNRFRGPVTARVALASSLNIPAVRTLEMVGVESFVRKLDELGFQNLRSPDHYGPSLSLGSADVSLWDMVNAYRSLANQGAWTPLRLVSEDSPETPRRVFSPEAAYLVANILSDRESRSVTFGLESPLSTRFWTASKTGTSKDMRDNWCVGWSERFTVGVWVGNFSGEAMWNVSGITGAAPVWLEIIEWLHATTPSAPPLTPSGIVTRELRFAETGSRVRERFVAGTETSEVRTARHPAAFKIAYPPSGSTIALDPDIPARLQKVFFEAVPPAPELRWVLNGKSLGSAASLLGWRPQPGSHLLRLVDRHDQTLDEIQFDVRGKN